MPLFLLLLAVADLPTGRLVESVKCAADPSQSYALYLPSRFSPDRVWPVIFAFDPGARGRIPVERYQAAAEKYGYIVAGSNNSRNGSWAVSMTSAQAMMTDVAARFALNPQRIYTAGMSGGARVALGVALGLPNIAGVIASSAGYPDSKPRKSVPFSLFGTAGTEDFNYLEMRHVDRELTTPHHLAIFEGGHVWLSSELATDAVEWMEIQAMKAGRKPRDEAEIDRGARPADGGGQPGEPRGHAVPDGGFHRAAGCLGADCPGRGARAREAGPRHVEEGARRRDTRKNWNCRRCWGWRRSWQWRSSGRGAGAIAVRWGALARGGRPGRFLRAADGAAHLAGTLDERARAVTGSRVPEDTGGVPAAIGAVSCHDGLSGGTRAAPLKKIIALQL